MAICVGRLPKGLRGSQGRDGHVGIMAHDMLLFCIDTFAGFYYFDCHAALCQASFNRQTRGGKIAFSANISTIFTHVTSQDTPLDTDPVLAAISAAPHSSSRTI